MRKFDVCLAPSLIPHYLDSQNESLAVVVDILRASTSICCAFASGAASISPVASIDEALQARFQGYLIAAERNAQKPSFADLGNSPFEYTPERVAGKHIVMTTTNGTACVKAASQASDLIVAGFSNLSATLRYIINSQSAYILVCCAGWNGRFCVEDTLFAGALAEALMSHQMDFTLASDAAMLARKLWLEAAESPFEFIASAEHPQRLARLGLEQDIRFCLTPDTTSLVPRYNRETQYLFPC